MTVILLATVGGSHQPLVTAIRDSRPDYVSFFCTDRDPATGRTGSRTQIEGNGLCIKRQQDEAAPTLPNIPVQCGLPQNGYDVRIVPADDLDAAFGVMRGAISELRARFPGATLQADYTGGTKTMTAALVVAALESDAVELRFVTGSRVDLVRVADGTQTAAAASVEGVRHARSMQPYLAAWERFAYSEAEAGLRRLPAPRTNLLRTAYVHARDFSAALAAWDRFDHAAAADLLKLYAPALGSTLAPYLKPVVVLAGTDSPARTGLLIWDLWKNALRRADNGRYDDAVARAYRMIEWSAQWLLDSRAGMKTSDLPAAAAAEVGVSPGRDGRYQAGLWAAWLLVERHVGGNAAQFIARQRAAMFDHLRHRNESILAHGFAPVRAGEWNTLHAWLEREFEPMLRAELGTAGVREPFPQLPQRYPGSATE